MGGWLGGVPHKKLAYNEGGSGKGRWGRSVLKYKLFSVLVASVK